MAHALKLDAEPRTRRISVLVNEAEYRRIEAAATAAGLSVSAYLRARALGEDDPLSDAEFERLMGRIEADLDTAAATIESALARMSDRSRDGDA